MSLIRRISVLSHCNDLGGKVWNPAIRWTKKHAVFVLLEDEDGRQGLGECWCFDASPEPLAVYLETEVASHFLGAAIEDVADIAARLTTRATLTARHGILASALAGIDIAAWDLRAQTAKQPIWSCLNPDGPGDALLYSSGGLYGHNKGTPELQAEMTGMAKQGFSLSKMKIGALELAQDIDRVKAVLDVLPSQSKLIIDGVYSYTHDQIMRLFDALPMERIEAIQSPLPAYDIAGMGRLATAGIPIMATEAEYRVELHRQLVEEAGIAFLQTAPVAAGGITRLEELKALVKGTDTRLSLEVSSTAVALMAACQIAAADAGIAHVEYHCVHQVFFDVLPLARCGTGRHRVPDTPGLGFALPDAGLTHHFTQPNTSQTKEP